MTDTTNRTNPAQKATVRSGYDLPPLPMSEFLKKMGEMPPKQEVIEGILPKNQIMLLTGDPWQGKSLEAQRLCCAFGAGGNYHGLNLKKCRAVYLTWEGDDQEIRGRFEGILKTLTPELEPIIKLAPEPMPLLKSDSYEGFRRLLSGLKSQFDISVVLVDSFTDLFGGKTSKTEDVQLWWERLRTLALTLDLTFIVTWELTKLVFTAATNDETEIFSLERLKSAYTTAYKTNTVVAIGELKKVVKQDGKATRAVLGHRIVILKAKDAKGTFEPLKVTLNRDTLCWNGEHWAWDKNERIWRAVAD